MALVKLGAMFSAMSGKVGGQVFVNNPKGQVIRNNAYTNKIPNSRQSKVRFNTATLSNLWHTLKPFEVALWEAQSVNYQYVNNVGVTVTRNAFQSFMYSNMMRNLIGLSYILTPETYFMPTAFTPTLTTVNPNTINIKAVDSNAAFHYQIYGLPLHTQNLKAYKSQMKFLGYLTSAQLLVGYNVLTLFNAYYGFLYTNVKYAVLPIPADLKSGQQFLGQNILYS